MLEAFRHIVHAAGYSMAGLSYLLRNEISARIEVAVIILALIWFAILGRSLAEYVILLMLACAVLGVEALNTAIEEIVDKMSPEPSEFAKATKDLGSTATFFTLSAGGLYIAAVTAESFGLIAWP